MDQVRSLKRGLDILRHLSAGGGARASEVASALDLSRGTVYRLLQTLVDEGYVVYSETDLRFRVTNLARTLGDGARGKTALHRVIRPLMAQYAKKLVWPIDFLTYENGAMVVVETTHGSSPMSIDYGMAGRRVPILRTAAGRAYLAHIPDGERAIIIEHLRRLAEPQDLPLLEIQRLQIMLQKVKEAGFAVRTAGEYRPETSGMAVPIVHDGGVMGCVSLIWIRKAITVEQAMASCKRPLRELASKASTALDGVLFEAGT